MKIYHGSKQVLTKPICHGSNPNNDYGPSFYVTTNYVDASIWANKNNTIGFVNEYEVNLRGLKVLDLTDKTKYSALHWICILLENRSLDHSFLMLNKKRIDALINKYHIDINEYDVIIGYRADDAYFRFPREFVNGNLSLELLEEVFRLGSLGIQYAFNSQKAIERIRFISANEADEKYLGAYFKQVKDATNTFDKLLKQSIDSNEGTRIGDLLK